jgi:SAM-dependent methyltransferase
LSTASLFDRYAYRYDSWYLRNPVIAENELRVVERLVCRSCWCLEVGVGSGYFASRLGVFFGVDPSISMLRIARSRGVEGVQGVGESLPVRSGSLDCVIVIVTLCFADDPARLILEASRAVKRRGSVIVCIVPKDSAWGRHYIEEARKGHPFYSFARFYSVREVEELLVSMGLRVVRRLGALSFEPGERPRREEPSSDVEGKGFVCIEAVKGGRVK